MNTCFLCSGKIYQEFEDELQNIMSVYHVGSASDCIIYRIILSIKEKVASFELLRIICSIDKNNILHGRQVAGDFSLNKIIVVVNDLELYSNYYAAPEYYQPVYTSSIEDSLKKINNLLLLG